VNTLYLIRNDLGPQLYFEVTREDTGAPVNCSVGTARFKVRKQGSSVVAFTLNTVSETENLEDGKLYFTLAGGELLGIEAGHYEGEIEITADGGMVETVYERIKIAIRDDY
jgi:hypothetical protein